MEVDVGAVRAGRVGAEVAAFVFEIFGFTALLLPILLLLTGWRRFWNREGQRVVGRGVGAVVVMVTLPALLQAIREVRDSLDL